MAQVKLEEETELWQPRGPAEERRGPGEERRGPGPPRVKEEPHEQLQELPVTPVTVKTEDKSPELHLRSAEKTREEPNGEERRRAEAGCSSYCEEQLKEEEEELKARLKEDGDVDSDWSWDWEPPIRRTVRKSISTMEPKPDFQFSSFAHVKTEENREKMNGEECGAEAGCSSNQRPYSCSDSEEDSDTEEDEERPHKCSYCGKCFKNTSHFNQHLKIHSGEKPYSCSVCEKAFLRSRTLTEHIRTHTGEKPFKCSICKNDFTSKARMKKHMKVHTGEKPFSCPFCTKRFVQRSFLVIHMRQHTGEKPFSCSLCHRSYTDKSSLRKHIKKHRTLASTDTT